VKIRELAAYAQDAANSQNAAQKDITGFFLVHQKDLRSNRAGDGYLSLVLGDDTGSVDARMWDNLETLPDFSAGDVVKVKGRVQLYRNRLQLSVTQLRTARAEEATPGDFLPKSTRDPKEMLAELRQIVSSVQQPSLRALLDAVVSDIAIADRLLVAPAAKSMHHAFRGGLLEHVLSLCKMCELAASHYRMIRRDLLMTGAILHDIGKIHELSYDASFQYTNEGQLVGHLVIGVEMVREKMRGLPDFPDSYRVLVEHLLLSHHGQLEFGSPKVPLFPEALLLHYLDDLDSKMEAMRAALAAAGGQEWTARSPALDRSLLNLDRFLGLSEPSAVADGSRPSRSISSEARL
jgi:3'-5' exoribonuclease